MRFKWILPAILIWILIPTLVFAKSESTNVPVGLKLAPEMMPDAVVTRDVLAYSAVKLSGNIEANAEETHFTDIADNNYAGYIARASNTGLMNGISDTEFAPDAEVTLITADIVMLRILGCAKIASICGEGEQGILNAAFRLGINTGVGTNPDKILTAEEFYKIIMNTIETKIPGLEQSDGISISKKSTRYMCDSLKLSVYHGEIVSCFGKCVDVNITSNRYKDNYTTLSAGTYKFAVSEDIDVYEMERVDSYIWVNSDDEIVYIESDGTEEVLYTHIYSVNGDATESSKYSAQYIEKINIYGDKKTYKTEKNVTVKYNGKEISREPIALNGNFAKLIIKDDRINYIDCWQLSNGGLITEVREDAIVYERGDMGKELLDNPVDYTDVTVIRDNAPAKLIDIKPNSIFYYYIDNDRLFIEVSEKVITEEFTSIADKEIMIGGNTYDKHKVYFSETGSEFKAESGYKQMFGTMVNAYFDPLGMCAYVQPADNAQVSGDFLGLLTKYYDSDAGSETYATVYVLEPSPEKKYFNVSNKVRYGNGISKEGLIQSAKVHDGDAVYLFKTNSKGEISSISAPDSVYGHGLTANIGKFPDADEMYVQNNGPHGYLLQWMGKAPIVVVYERYDELVVKNIKWSDIRGYSVKSPEVVRAYIYGRNLEYTPRLVLLSTNIDMMYYDTRNSGLLVKGDMVLNDKDEVCYEVDILAATPRHLILPEEEGRNLPDYGLVTFYSMPSFIENNVMIEQVLPLEGEQENWNVTQPFFRGTIKRIDARRVFIEDGSEYGAAMFMYTNYILEYNPELKGTSKFKRISTENVKIGSEIIYYTIGGEEMKDSVRGMIVFPPN